MCADDPDRTPPLPVRTQFPYAHSRARSLIWINGSNVGGDRLRSRGPVERPAGGWVDLCQCTRWRFTNKRLKRCMGVISQRSAPYEKAFAFGVGRRGSCRLVAGLRHLGPCRGRLQRGCDPVDPSAGGVSRDGNDDPGHRPAAGRRLKSIGEALSRLAPVFSLCDGLPSFAAGKPTSPLPIDSSERGHPR